MIKFTKNDISKAKALACHDLNLDYSARRYLNECKDDVHTVYLKAKYLCLDRKYEEAVELLKPYLLENNFDIIDLYLTVAIGNLQRFNEAYNFMQMLANKRKCFGYYGLFSLSGSDRNMQSKPAEFQRIEYVEKAFKCANFDDKITLTYLFSNILTSPVYKDFKTKELGHKLKFKTLYLASVTPENKLYFINKFEREDELIQKRFKKEFKKIIFKNFDPASALLIGLYMIKHNNKKKIDYNDDAFILFNFGHSKKDKLCSILYALKFGHKGINDEESLTKARSILKNAKDIYATNLCFVPPSLYDTYLRLIDDFHISLYPSIMNLYKPHPFLTGKK